MRKTLLAIIMLLLAGTLLAQQVTVQLKCAKPDQDHSLPAGDAADHLYDLSHTTCAYTKPATLAGVQTKGGGDTIFTDINGNRMEWHGVYVETYSNGDKIYYRHHGSGTLKNNVFDTGTDYYEVTGGTGKLQGYKGKGSCTIKGNADGSATDECSADYTAPK
jgi:hypothetical protein